MLSLCKSDVCSNKVRDHVVTGPGEKRRNDAHPF